MLRRLMKVAVASLLSVMMSRAYATEVANPAVTVAHTPEGTKMVTAARGADGTIHLLLQKDNAPFYATSKDDGKALSTPIPVINAKIATPGLEFLGWDMTVTEKGRVLVVMGNNAWKLKLPEDQWGMYLATLEPGAKEFGPTIPLNGVSSEGFSILAGKGGKVVAGYLRGKLMWKQSTDDGKTFGPNQEIDTSYLPCPCCTTSLAFGADGTLAVLYREATNDHRDMYVVLNKDGQHTRTRISQTLWDINACPMTYFKIEAAGDGFAAAWPTRGQVYFTRIDSSGKAWAPGEIKVGGKSSMRSSIFALAGANDTTLAAWKVDDKLHWRIFDAAGKPLGSEGEAPGAGPQAGGVVDTNGGFILFP